MVLFADISGFTALAERLAQRGPDGAEELSRLLNVSFGPMVELILRAGGDIIRFAGDAPIVLFRPDHDDDAALAGLVQRAATLGVALQNTLRSVAAAEQLPLGMRVSVGAGALVASSVGGVEGRREFLVRGAPFAQLVHAQALARPGDVVLSAEAATLLGDRFPTIGLGSGARLVALNRAEVVPADVPLPSEQADLSAFVPRSVVRLIEAGQSAWAAELRPVTVLFAQLRGVDALDTPLARVDDVFRAVQQAIYAAGGTINQFLADDKGIVLLAAWGLPGGTHGDDASRAVRAALLAMRSTTALGVPMSAGIATGRVFCGWRGSEHRREYAMVGDVVNLAARLMVAADGTVVCDSASASAAAATIAFAPMVEFRVKGKEQPIPTRVALREREGPPTGEIRIAAVTTGRDHECQVIHQAVQAAAAQEGRILLVHGEAGIGKSLLLDHLAGTAEASGVRHLRGTGDPVIRGDSYRAWRGILSALLALPSAADREGRNAALRAYIADDAWLAARAPLLGGILDVALPETDVTSLMTDAVRTESLRDVVVHVVGLEAERGPLAVVFDDAHWLDSLSWSAILAVSRRVPSLLLAVAARPFEHDEPAEWHELATAPGATTLEIGRLARADAATVMATRLGVAHVPDAAVTLVMDRSGGHPLLIGELTLALRDRGLLAVTGDSCRLTADVAVLRDLQFPDTVQGMVISRIDRLAPREQLLVKVASVIGVSFDAALLRAIHPVPGDRDDLDALLTALTRDGTIASADDGRAATFVFRQTITQEVAYELMATEQRRALHAAVATRLEAERGDRPPFAALAHHCVRAAEYVRGVGYLDEAGEQAFAAGGDREAARAFRSALEITTRERLTHVEPLVRARWNRRLADALQRAGEYAESRAIIAEAMATMGAPFPVGRGALLRRLGWEAARQLLHLVIPAPLRTPFRRTSLDRLRELALLQGLVSSTAFYANDDLTRVVSCFMAVNTAEAAGKPAPAATAYVSLAYIAATLRLNRLADRWWREVASWGDRRTRTEALQTRALARLADADWDAAIRDAQEGLALAESGSDRSSIEACHFMLAGAYLSMGRLDDALTAARALTDSAVARDNRQRQTWGFALQAGIHCDRGDHDAMRAAAVLLMRAAEGTDAATLLGVLSTRLKIANTWLDLPELEEVAAALDVMGGGRVGFGGLLTQINVARATIALWDVAPRDRARRARAYAAVRGVQRVTPIAPMVHAAAANLTADLAWRDGQLPRARRAWQRAVALGVRTRTPIEAGIAHLRLAETATSEPERSTHRAAAAAIAQQTSWVSTLRALPVHTSHKGIG